MQAAEALGITQQQLYSYLTGRSKVGATIREKLRAHGYFQEVNPKFVGWTKVTRIPPVQSVESTTAQMPMVIESQLRHPKPFEQLAGHLNLGVFTTVGCFAMQVISTQLVSGKISKGDWLIIDINKTPKSGDLVIARIGTELWTKRFTTELKPALIDPTNNITLELEGIDAEVLAVVLTAIVIV